MTRERSFTWSDPKLTAGAATRMAGLDLIRGVRDGTIPARPIASLVGLSVAEEEAGRTVMRLAPAKYHYNPVSWMHGGILATLPHRELSVALLAHGRFGRVS